MKIRFSSLAPAFLAVLWMPVAVNATSLTLSEFQEEGGAPYASASNLSLSGGKVTYVQGAAEDMNNIFIRSALDGSFTFTGVGQRISYTFVFQDLVIPVNAGSPQMRSGFVLENATIRHTTSMGTGGSLSFAREASNNFQAMGTPVGAVVEDWSPFDKRGIRFDDGNTIQATVTLELIAIRGGDSFDFIYRVTYENPDGIFNAAVQLFEEVPSATITAVFHGTNWSGTQNAEGMTWSVANASLATLPISGAPALATYRADGAAPYASADDLSTEGGRVTFGQGEPNDLDTIFIRSDLEEAFTFTEVGEIFQYTFTFRDLTIPVNAFGPQMRTGIVFEFDILQHRTSLGSAGNLDFRQTPSTSIYGSGFSVGETISDWSDFWNRTIRMATGNVIEASVYIELLAIRGDGYHDYRYTVGYSNPNGVSKTVGQVFENVWASSITGVFHGTNWSGTQNAVGMTWRIADADVGLLAADSYEGWALGYGTNPRAEGARDQDANGDGVKNVVKYAMGQSPVVFGQQPPLSLNNGFLEIEYTRNPAVMDQVEITAQTAPQVSGKWSEVGVVDELVSTTGDGLENRVARAVVDGDRRFFRLLVRDR